jgi:ubiquinone/menaquinone biosynthesis C-methylase UbiE
MTDQRQNLSTRGIVLHHAAGVYDLLSPAMLFYREKAINRRAATLLELQPYEKVLDIGCATGRVTFDMARHLDGHSGGLAVGVDASPEMIAKACRKLHNEPCRFDLGLAERLPYEDHTFDKCISTFFFHHLRLEDKLAALREAARVLRPGGLFVLVDVDRPTTWFGRLCAESGQWLFRQPEIGENIDGKLPPLFEEAGFTSRRAAHDLGYVTTFVLSHR